MAEPMMGMMQPQCLNCGSPTSKDQMHCPMCQQRDNKASVNHDAIRKTALQIAEHAKLIAQHEAVAEGQM